MFVSRVHDERIFVINDVVVSTHPGILRALSGGDDDLLWTALGKGLRKIRSWSHGTVTDLETTLGNGWLFGVWSDEEPVWLEKAYLPFVDGF